MVVSKRHIQSIERAMMLLEKLKMYPDGASLAELCTPNGLTKSTAHGLLNTLTDLGYVSHQGAKYSVGTRVHALASATNDPREEIHETFIPALRAFNELCELDCYLAIASGARTYLTLEAFDQHGRSIVPCIDSQRDAIRTSAIGKVFMAHDPALARTVRRNAPLERSVEDELVRISICGFALDSKASQAGLNCMAIPLRFKGKVVAALGASGESAHLHSKVL